MGNHGSTAKRTARALQPQMMMLRVRRRATLARVRSMWRNQVAPNCGRISDNKSASDISNASGPMCANIDNLNANCSQQTEQTTNRRHPGTKYCQRFFACDPLAIALPTEASLLAKSCSTHNAVAIQSKHPRVHAVFASNGREGSGH